MKFSRRFFLLATALTIVACGDSNETGGDGVTTVNTEDGILVFMPEDITISTGDTVRFVMTDTHNALEVSQETYDARGTTPLEGGFEVDFGQTGEVTFDTPGVHYYVCTPHATVGMIGTITVR
ncbi:MAG: plastocyanin/azurin family copper-binding protein [Myxococcota bacterium]